MLTFVLRDHFRLALHAALLFAAGLFASWPVVHYRLRAVSWLPMAVLRMIVRAFGASPSVARMAAVIGCFNTAAIFLYMASGVHPLLPKAFGVWTGLNVGVVMGMGRGVELMGRGAARQGQWVPSRPLTAACGLLVMALELPSFWFSIAMGISMGQAVAGGGQPYWQAVAERAAVYAAVIVPTLLVSAAAEAVAIRGLSGRA